MNKAPEESDLKRDSTESSGSQASSRQSSQQLADEFNAGAIFGRGLVSCIVPMVNAVDNSVDSVRSAQVELSKQLEMLSNSLRSTQDSEAKGPELDGYAKRLANCRRRLMVTSTLLNNIQTRMSRLQTCSRKVNEMAKQQARQSVVSTGSMNAASSGGLAVG